MPRPTSWPPVHFDHPPVVEVACGVVFEPIPELTSAHMGVLWGQFGPDFPKTTDQPALPLVPAEARPGETYLQVTQGVQGPRTWYLSDDERKLIQVQRDRLHFNWRERDKTDVYPRFPAVYGEFKRHLATFNGFLAQGGVDPIRPLQYELAYVNRISPADQVWSEPRHVARVFPDLAWRDDDARFLGPPDHARAEFSFALPEGCGRLWATMGVVRRKDTGERELALDFTARGAAGTKPIDDWFALAHEWIVQGFVDLTGPEMHDSVWKRRFGQ